MPTIDDEAGRQRGYIDRAQLRALGTTDHQISTLLHQHHLQHPHPGVYRHGSVPPEWEDRVRAACLAAGGGSRAMGRTAARLHGLEGHDHHGIIELTVPKGHGPVPEGVFIRETRRLDAALTAEVRGIPVSSINQTLLELAWKIRADLPVERAVEDAFRRGFPTSEGALRRFLAGCGKGVPGVSHLRSVLDARAGGRPARSGFEVIVFDIIRSAGLELPVRRPLVSVPPDQKYELDLAYVERKIDIEAMGGWHATPRQRQLDAERRRILVSLGWTIIEVWWDDAIHHPERVVAMVRAALLSGSTAPEA